MIRIRRLLPACTLLVFLLLGSCGAGGGASPFAPGADTPVPGLLFDGARALEHGARILDLGPRFAGVPGHAAVIDYMESSLAAAGLQVRRVPFTSAAQGLAGLSFTNLIAHAEPLAGPALLFGAHFDSLPDSPHDPDPAKRHLPMPGANDNAGGVGLLLELARVLKERGLTRDIAFVMLDAEERVFTPQAMFAGSRDLVARRAELFPAGIAAFVLVDMVGDADLAIPREGHSRTHAPALLDALFAAARSAGATAFRDEPGPWISDDHVPFLDAGIPAVDLIDFDYPHWHTTHDTLDKLSAASLGQVGRALERFVLDR